MNARRPYTEPELRRLRAMVVKGYTAEMIGLRLGRTTVGIESRMKVEARIQRREAGIVLRPKGERTPQLDAAFRRGYEGGLPLRYLRELFHVHHQTLLAWAQELGMSRVEKKTGSPPATSPRRCVPCKRMFDSTGPHNRVCGQCKDSDDWKHGTDNVRFAGISVRSA